MIKKKTNKTLLLILTLIMIFTGCSALAITSDEAIETTTQSTSQSTTSSNTTDLDGYSAFFTTDKVHKIEIVIPDGDFEKILEDPEAEEFYSADITLDGVSVSNVGFRTKGNSTLRSVANSDSMRYSFKVKVDKYEDDQLLIGLDEFVLNNNFADPSYMREILSYNALSAIGENVSQASFVNVYINGELYGLYTMVETVDDSFLNNNFGDNDGTLYRMDQGSNLIYKENDNLENAVLKNGDDESKEDLRFMIKVLNDMPEGEKGGIESVLDVDSALRYIAANTVLESYDSYSGQFAQNYYLYNNDGIFTVIPWDYNMSFGGFMGGKLSSIDIDEPISGTNMDSVPLIKNLLAVPEYKERYYDILEDFIEYFDNFDSVVAGYRELIDDSVSNDPSKFSTYDNFLNTTVYVEGGAYESENEGPNQQFGPPNMQEHNDATNGDVNSVTSATNSQNSEANMQSGEGNTKNGFDPNRPAPPNNGDRPTPPNGVNMPPNGDRPEGMEKQGGEIKMPDNNLSIINILKARLENIELQLEEKGR